jgi:hypothetical protein
MRVAVQSVDLALWKTRNFVFFVGIIAMNYTIMRPSPVDMIFVCALALCLVVNQTVRVNFVVLTVFLLAWGLSYFFASVPHLYELWRGDSVVFELVAKTFVLMIAFTACYISTTWDKAHYETFMKVYVATCTIASVLGTIGFALQLDMLTWDSRARGLLDDPNMYGSMVVPSLLCALYLLHFGVVRRWIMLLVLPILGIGVLLSFSRIAIVASLVTCTGFIFFLNRTNLKRLVPAIVALIGLGAVLFAILSMTSEEFTQKFLQRLTFAESYDLGEQGRYGRYLLVIPMILENPMGVGVLQLEKIFPEPIHNIWLSSFVNYGWGGGFTWLLLVGCSIWRSIDNYRRTRSPVAILLLFTYIAVIMCASLHEGEHWRHMWLMLGVLWGFSPANFGEALRRMTAAIRPAKAATLPVPATAIPRAMVVRVRRSSIARVGRA